MSTTSSTNGPAGDPLAGVPDVIRHYFELDASRAIDSIVSLFDDDATVIDEGQTRNGKSEIRGWQTGPASKYTYTTEVLATEVVDQHRYVVAGRLTGDFPGGIAELKWDFKLAGDQIDRLIIAP
jgi:hypothetical protein